ncbi:hypothetical protein ABUW04_34915 [Streptacidiphilus sp. N1-10]|uniref:Uncharacterized protein n=1 Tax=Streptacidiphilus jeojiensis TaxID=3229225 RepID=A0ABV6XYU1_9ACTN
MNDGTAPWEQATEFEVVFTFRVKQSSWLVQPKGGGTPLLRGVRPGGPESVRAYLVDAGPALDQRVGAVGLTSAADAEGTRIGTVSQMPGAMFQDDVWTVVQTDLGAFSAKPVGLASRARHTPLTWGFTENVADLVSRHRLRFSSRESKGFEVGRRAGLRSQYDVKVLDSRVNRLLVLATVVHFDSAYGDANVGKLVPSITGLFRR